MENKKYLYWAFQSSQNINPSEEDLERFQIKYKKNFETRELYEGKELEEQYKLKGSKNPMFSFISSFILAFEHEGTLRIKYIVGKESDLIQTFTNLLRNDFQDYSLVHFDAEVVLPYYGVRANKNGFITPPHKDLKYNGAKDIRPWNLTGVDIKQYYKGAGNYSFSLEEIAYNLNLDYEGIIPYDEEPLYFKSCKFIELKKSAIKKVEVLSKIHRTLEGKPELETVLVEEEVENVEEQKPTNWLVALYHSRELTEEIREGIRSQIKGKRVLKRDRENLFTILRGVMVRTDFINKDQDSKKVIEEKENSINEFLNTI